VKTLTKINFNPILVGGAVPLAAVTAGLGLAVDNYTGRSRVAAAPAAGGHGFAFRNNLAVKGLHGNIRDLEVFGGRLNPDVAGADGA